MLLRVPTASTRPQRARNAEEKRKRRAEILKAAEQLWLGSTYTELSMNQVAREAQLAKGTLYLYFNTKEELFLALLSEHLRAWLQEILSRMEAARPRTPDEVADFFIAATLHQDALRRLLVLLNTVIDPGISAELALEFRQRTLRHILPILELMPFQRQTNLRILMNLYALSIGWHLVASGPDLGTLPAPVGQHHSPRPTFEEGFPVALRAVIHSLTRE